MTNRQDLEALCVQHKVSSHAAKGPLFLYFPGGKIYLSTDRKAKGYPQVNFVDKSSFWGGNWNKPEFTTPADLYRTEVSEEIAPLATLVNRGTHVFEEYFAQIPQAVHGNAKKGMFLNPVTLFVSHIWGPDALDALKLPRTASPAELHDAITKASDFNYSSLYSLDSIKNGALAHEPQFAWGDDVMLADVLKAEFAITPAIAKLPGIIVERIDDIALNAPYAGRWTTQYDRLNPLKNGASPDAAVFT